MSQDDASSRHPADLIPRLAAIIHSDGFPNGDRARLKRMGVTGPTPLAYHRFLLRHVAEQWQGESLGLAWRTLISAIARQHHNPHNPAIAFGRALAECRYSESRLESLLAAEDRVLATLTLRAGILLAAKRSHCNWKDIGWLLFTASDSTREKVNRRIARDFYHTSDAAARQAVIETANN